MIETCALSLFLKAVIISWLVFSSAIISCNSLNIFIYSSFAALISSSLKKLEKLIVPSGNIFRKPSGPKSWYTPFESSTNATLSSSYVDLSLIDSVTLFIQSFLYCSISFFLGKKSDNIYSVYALFTASFCFVSPNSFFFISSGKPL